MTAARIPPDSVPMQFGMFYPRGYLAVAFREAGDAMEVRHALIESGYQPEDAQIVSPETVADGATRSLASVKPIVRMLGCEQDVLTAHAELAKQGYTFMLIYGPSALDTERAMTVVRRFHYGLAHKFERFAVHQL
jgi:hypothetical protein